MNNRVKYTLAAVMATAAVFAYGSNLRRGVPACFGAVLRDAPKDPLKDANPAGVAGETKIPGISAKPVEWITVGGGKFTMGTDGGEKGFEDAGPSHEVAVKTFDMSKTEVTVEQYAECVNKGRCTKPGGGENCNWGAARRLHPVNCVDWDQANEYAKFKGARLPSEAEWEYAAKSGGKNRKYPWGEEEPTCDRVVMYGKGGGGCGANSTMPVCSKPAGNTAQGLCDMVGNVWEWVQDNYQDSYRGAPADGSAFEDAGSLRVIRGGSFHRGVARALRADRRRNRTPDSRNGNVGFRLVKLGN